MDLGVVRPRGCMTLVLQQPLVAGVAGLPVPLENLQDARAEIDAVPRKKLAGVFGATPRDARSPEA